MKKLSLLLIMLLGSLCSFAQSKTEVTDSVAFYISNVQVYQGISKSGNPTYWIELPRDNAKPVKVWLSEAHINAGDRKLALIERRNLTTGKYTYSVKFAEPKTKSKSNGKAHITLPKSSK